MCLCALAHPAMAREKHSARPMDSYDAEQLALNSLGVVRRAPPAIKLVKIRDTFPLFIPVGQFMLFLQVPKGTHYESQLAYAKGDPATLFEEVLTQAIVKTYAPLEIRRTEEVPPSGASAEQLHALFPESNYVLDVRSRTIIAAARKAFGKTSWVGYGVDVRLMARGMERPVFSGSCYIDTVDDPDSPSVQELTADDARLFYETLGSLAWQCLHRVAADLKLPAEAIPPIPPQLVDPLTAFAARNPRAQPAQKASAPRRTAF